MTFILAENNLTLPNLSLSHVRLQEIKYQNDKLPVQMLKFLNKYIKHLKYTTLLHMKGWHESTWLISGAVPGLYPAQAFLTFSEVECGISMVYGNDASLVTQLQDWQNTHYVNMSYEEAWLRQDWGRPA